MQVSPLFGTIYNSILFMAHAVHRVRQSQEWMSGGNLARHTRNLAFQVLRDIFNVNFKGLSKGQLNINTLLMLQGFSHLVKTNSSGAALLDYLILDTDGLSWELKPTYR